MVNKQSQYQRGFSKRTSENLSEHSRRRRSVAWSESDPVRKPASPQRDAVGGIAVRRSVMILR